MNIAYLGDSVYIEFMPERDGYQLYLNNGGGKENIIYLEPDVLNNLFNFIKENMG